MLCIFFLFIYSFFRDIAAGIEWAEKSYVRKEGKKRKRQELFVRIIYIHNSLCQLLLLQLQACRIDLNVKCPF